MVWIPSHILKKKLDNLKKAFTSLNEACELNFFFFVSQLLKNETIVDNVNADLGPEHYKKAKKRTMSLRVKKRENSYKDLKEIFQQGDSNSNEGK